MKLGIGIKTISCELYNLPTSIDTVILENFSKTILTIPNTVKNLYIKNNLTYFVCDFMFPKTLDKILFFDYKLLNNFNENIYNLSLDFVHNTKSHNITNIFCFVIVKNKLYVIVISYESITYYKLNENFIKIDENIYEQETCITFKHNFVGKIIFEELVKNVFHPHRLLKYAKKYNLTVYEYLDFL